MAVTGGEIPRVAYKIAELTGGTAVEGFRSPPPEEEIAAVIVDWARLTQPVSRGDVIQHTDVDLVEGLFVVTLRRLQDAALSGNSV